MAKSEKNCQVPGNDKTGQNQRLMTCSWFLRWSWQYS